MDELDLMESTGNLIRIGDTVLEITGETLPCPRMDEQKQGLTQALEPFWRAGVTCNVEEGGAIRLGDKVKVERTVSAGCLLVQGMNVEIRGATAVGGEVDIISPGGD